LSTRSARWVAALCGLVLSTGTGCWEQWSQAWFPQMKQQPAVQAFESTEMPSEPWGIAAFPTPEGAVPVDGGDPPIPELDPWVVRVADGVSKPASDAEANALVNPRPANFESLKNGQLQFETFCAPCHGLKGMADGPVAKAFPGVLPLVVANARTDGHVFTTIRQGRRRMPPYGRLPEQDRWDIVNYVRYLNGNPGQKTAMGGQP